MFDKYKDDGITLLYILMEYSICTIVFTVLFTAIDFVTLYLKGITFIFTFDIVIKAFCSYTILDLLSVKYVYTKRWIKENE